MKERSSFTLDKESIRKLDSLVKSSKYRNRSHAVEVAIRMLEEKENGKSSDSEEDKEKNKEIRKQNEQEKHV